MSGQGAYYSQEGYPGFVTFGVVGVHMAGGHLGLRFINEGAEAADKMVVYTSADEQLDRNPSEFSQIGKLIDRRTRTKTVSAIH